MLLHNHIVWPWGGHTVNIKESIYSYALRNKTFTQTISFTQSI